MPGFNINLAIQLQGPYGLDRVARQIQTGLQGVSSRIEIQGIKEAAAGLEAVRAKGKEVQSALSSAATEASRLSSSFARTGTFGGAESVGQIKATAAAMRDMSRDAALARSGIDGFSSQVGTAARRFITFSTAAGSIAAFTAAVHSGIAEAVNFDRELIKVQQVSNDSRQSIKSLGETITSLSTRFGVSSKDLASTAVVFKQAGLTLDETRASLEAVAKAAIAPNFDSMAQTAEGAIAIMKQFGVSAKGLEGALGSVNAVAGDFAVEAGDLVEVVKRAGGTFAATGGNLNELLALFTSVRATTRESAESISTGLRTIFTRLQRTSTVDALKDLNIQLRYTAEEAASLGKIDLENQFVGPYEAVRRLSEGLKDLRTTDPRYSAVLETLGGYRQVGKVTPLLQQFSEAQRALSTAQTGGISLTNASEKGLQALAVQTAKVREEFLGLSRGIVDSKEFRELAGIALSTASAFIKLTESVKPFIPLITAIGVAKAVSTINVAGAGRAFTGGFLGSPSNPRYYAAGGKVPGVGNTDSVHAVVQPGEYILNKASSERIGYDLLHELANSDDPRSRLAAKLKHSAMARGLGMGGFMGKRFAKGGLVGFDPSNFEDFSGSHYDFAQSE